ncbi:MBL fold metallo-hydrolase [Leclercia pneumoniae]|uniref:MBL fold metallo-hydrolase n=1 Tax=Leclercia pneumoniae TaxID=2815358 RepID=A0ABX8JZ00_9ENTR|nr:MULTISPECIES: MBL fold metallo-hydrolase [Leclercia]QSW36475.1 MBL fold metallo-hydrolase [Leclercia pneumoniae]QWW78607.1 MBL fold metallo-hydrolase [Leclercia pneumoniae]
MQLTQIRNATLKLDYAGVRFLIDPMLADKEAWPGFPGTARSHLRNPLVALPVSVDTLLDVDVIIVTHTHQDHWDEAAQQLIPKDKVIYTQNESDASLIRSQGFTAVSVLADTNVIAGINVVKTDGQHGSDEAYAIPEVAERLGDACGLVFSAEGEKTLYIAGDTIWVPPYVSSLKKYAPDVVVLNIGCATVDGIGAIIMGKEDALRTLEILPAATLVASHMEAVNHCLLSRAELRAYTAENGLQQKVRVPEDGETLSL